MDCPDSLTSINMEIDKINKRQIQKDKKTTLAVTDDEIIMRDHRLSKMVSKDQNNDGNEMTEKLLSKDNTCSTSDEEIEVSDLERNDIAINKTLRGRKITGEKTKAATCNTDVKVKNKRKKSSLNTLSSNTSVTEEISFEMTICDKGKRPKRKANNVLSYKENISAKHQTRDIQISSHFTDIFKKLQKLQFEGKFCDVMLKACEGYISVHKLVLMAGSSYFCEKIEKMERVGEDGIKCLDLSHIPYWALEYVVTFIYTGKLQVLKTKQKEFAKHCKSLGLKELSEKINSKDDDASGCKQILDTVKAKLSTNGIQTIKKTGHCGSDDVEDKVIYESLLQVLDTRYEGVIQKNESKPENTLGEKNKTCQEKKLTKESRNTIIKPKRVYKEVTSKLKNNSNKTDTVPVKKQDQSVRNLDNVLKKRCKNGRLRQKSIQSNVCQDNELIEKTNVCEPKHEATETGEESVDVCINKTNVKSKTEVRPKELEATNEEPNAPSESVNRDSVNDLNDKCSTEVDSYNDSDIDDTKLLDNDTDYNSGEDDDAETDVEYKPSLKKAKMNKELKEFKTNCDEVIKSKLSKGIARKKAGCETQCKICEEHFTSKEDLKNHRKACKGHRPRRRCILCKISFETADEYVHHRETDEKCLEIRQQKHQKRLKRKAQLRSRFACRVCPRKFRRVADHIDHEFVAHDLPYDKEEWPDLFCEWCSYWTMNPWRLHHHKTYDCSKGQEYICELCGNKYKNEKTLKCHVEMMHTDALPMLTCEQCGKTLKGPKGLEHHVRIMHKGENPHKRHMCHICSMKYTSSSDLIFHLHRVHDQPLPEEFVVYQCQKCDYVINNKRTYQKHMLLHDDKRDWKCDRCTKAFKTRNSLHTHMKSHLGLKMPCPYDDCSYAALKKCHLKTHIENQHTQKGVKNEQCHVCSYSTFFKGNLIKHLRTVHQLEVVTRYSVQMKAKYKNLKTGQIVGALTPVESQKTKKNLDTIKVDKGAELAKPHTQTNPEENNVMMATGVSTLNVTDSHYNTQITAGLTHTIGQPLPQLDHHNQEVPGHKFDNQLQTVTHTPQMPSTAPQNINPAYMYAMGSASMTHHNPSDLSNLNVIYCNPQDLSVTPSGPSISRPANLVPTGNSIREVNMTFPNIYGGKVVAPGMFQPQGMDDEVTNAAKMLTYFQM